MVEPHLFCGPEFVLEVPAEHPQPIQRHVLLQLQTELYSLLTPTVRRKIHTTHGSHSGSGDIVPPPPDSLLFIDMESTPPTDAGNEDDYIHVPLLVTDSRAAAELFSIGLKNPFIALPHRMRLRNHYAGGGGKPRAPPAEILRKKESLRSRMNFDEDLWETLQKALTPEWLQEFESRYCQIPEGGGTVPMRDAEQHEQRVESLLRYCEREVQYVGVMDEEGNASPFLLAMGVFYRFGLIYRDAFVHFVRHPRRPIRALALFIARYTAAPEELEPFFAPSLTDVVTIACAEDANVTTSMRQLCADLLLCDEVCEAWPPTYHAYWVEHKVRPMMQRIEAECKRREELRLTRRDEGGGGGIRVAANMTPTNASRGNEETKVRGSGGGVGVFGFRNMRELQAYVRERERVLVPQRILSMTAAPKKGDGDGVYYSDLDDDDDGDDDDFLIKVRVEGSRSGRGAARSTKTAPQEVQKQKRGAERRKRARESEITTNTRALVMTGAYRTVLRLLGRTEPFDRRGEHYLTF
ncbi:hypothetical protein BCY84_05825 [Trypanosoma cruzi cruzi]|uniref:Pre-mRNA-splicing factor 38 C-terminal domain-containing protein n=1 Tax=Trypanosoma cruzi TaxID=5693 RepID=A0A2V2VVN1_TRYCR|nr:hypothetical protein BCY84_05825 [Trypanosoma cruzi cruzi]PWU98403.1 hypothetical protein C4B63_12g314 [Trypanosoma cruzi]